MPSYTSPFSRVPERSRSNLKNIFYAQHRMNTHTHVIPCTCMHSFWWYTHSDTNNSVRMQVHTTSPSILQWWSEAAETLQSLECHCHPAVCVTGKSNTIIKQCSLHQAWRSWTCKHPEKMEHHLTCLCMVKTYFRYKHVQSTVIYKV